MEISLIVAIANNGVIGKGNTIPWMGKLPKDIKLFRETTTGHVVIMGRKTYDSFDPAFRPLPKRLNVVITRNMELLENDHGIENLVYVKSFAEAILATENSGLKIFIIGGVEIFKWGLTIADTLLITRVGAEIEGDVFFPEWNKDDFLLLEQQTYVADEKNQYSITFQKLERR